MSIDELHFDERGFINPVKITKWLYPVQEDHNRGFNPSQQRRIRDILREHQDAMLERWYETFGKPSDG